MMRYAIITSSTTSTTTTTTTSTTTFYYASTKFVTPIITPVLLYASERSSHVYTYVTIVEVYDTFCCFSKKESIVTYPFLCLHCKKEFIHW